MNRANVLLFIIRNYVNKLTLRAICFAIFDSHINYFNLMWGQNLHSLSKIIILQKKALRIMNFQSRNSYSSPLFRSKHILKLKDKILIENILFINKFLKNLPPIFKSWFTFCSDLRIKLNISSVICHLKHSTEPKLKVYFSITALESINEEVKGVLLIKQINLL